MTGTNRTVQQIELLNEELEDVQRQLVDGDIDEASAAILTSRYSAELEALVAKQSPASASEDGEGPATHGRIGLRAFVGAIVVGFAVVAIAVFAVVSLNDDSRSGVEGLVESVLNGAEGRDLSTVSNEEMEAVVAANPDVVLMRLALARRYFEAGEFAKALEHYFEVLDRERHPEALANVGWMTYLSGRPDVAAGYLEAALERDPTYLTARWFLGNIYASLGRSDEAIVLLASVADADETPNDIKELAIELIDQLGNPDGS